MEEEEKRKMKERDAEEVLEELRNLRMKEEDGKIIQEEKRRFDRDKQVFYEIISDILDNIDFKKIVRFQMTQPSGHKRYLYLTPDWEMELGETLTSNTYLNDYTGVIGKIEGEADNDDDSWLMGWVSDEKVDDKGNVIYFDDNEKEWITREEALRRYLENISEFEFIEEKERILEQVKKDIGIKTGDEE